MVTASTCPASTQETNSLKLTRLSLRWKLEEKFHTRATTTIRTIQNTRLFKVEFKIASGRIYRLRVKTTTASEWGVTRNGSPTTWPATQAMRPCASTTTGTRETLVARHLPVDEDVLQLLTTAKAERLHPISRLPPPDGEMPAECHRVQDRPG